MRTAFVIAAGAAAAAVAWAVWRSQQDAADSTDDDTDENTAPTLLEEISVAAAEAANVILSTPAVDMTPSEDLKTMLKAGEALRLTRYRLNDGGWTIGYGRYFPDGGAVPPERITAETAEQWFAEDIEARAARWVRAYVNVNLTQQQFDALCSMAYNLKPSSFKTIAQAVNDGEDPENAALRYVRAGTGKERGLRNRMAREIALYREGIYTA